MVSVQHTYFVADATDVHARFQERIEKALDKHMPVSFFAVAPMHYTQEKMLLSTIKRVLASSNSRVNADWIVREADTYSFYVILGAELENTVERINELQQHCDAVHLRVVGSAMYLPRQGTIEERTHDVYECLKNGIADHRRTMPQIYPREFTLQKDSSPRVP